MPVTTDGRVRELGPTTESPTSHPRPQEDVRESAGSRVSESGVPEVVTTKLRHNKRREASEPAIAVTATSADEEENRRSLSKTEHPSQRPSRGKPAVSVMSKTTMEAQPVVPVTVSIDPQLASRDRGKKMQATVMAMKSLAEKRSSRGPAVPTTDADMQSSMEKAKMTAALSNNVGGTQNDTASKLAHRVASKTDPHSSRNKKGKEPAASATCSEPVTPSEVPSMGSQPAERGKIQAPVLRSRKEKKHGP